MQALLLAWLVSLELNLLLCGRFRPGGYILAQGLVILAAVTATVANKSADILIKLLVKFERHRSVSRVSAHVLVAVAGFVGSKQFAVFDDVFPAIMGVREQITGCQVHQHGLGGVGRVRHATQRSVVPSAECGHSQREKRRFEHGLVHVCWRLRVHCHVAQLRGAPSCTSVGVSHSANQAVCCRQAESIGEVSA
jgi:hypothetical protein